MARGKPIQGLRYGDDILFLSPLKEGQKVSFYVVEKRECVFGDRRKKTNTVDASEKWWHKPRDIKLNM